MAAAGGAGPLRWYQIPLSSARAPPRTGLFSPRFQAGLQRYQELRAHKQLRVGRPFALPPPGLLEAAAAAAAPAPPPARRPREPPPGPRPRRRRRRRRRAGSAQAPGGGSAAGDGEDVLGPLRELLLAGDEARGPATGPPRAPAPRAQRQEPLAGHPDPQVERLDPLAEHLDPRAQCLDPRAQHPDPLVEHQDPRVQCPDLQAECPDLLVEHSDPLANSPDPLASGLDPLANSLDPLARGQDPLASGPDPLSRAPDPLASGLDPLGSGLDPLTRGSDPLASGPDPLANRLDPLASGPDPLTSGPDPQVKGLDPQANGLDLLASSPHLLTSSPDPLVSGADSLASSSDPLAYSPAPLSISLDSLSDSLDPPGAGVDLLATPPAPPAANLGSVATGAEEAAALPGPPATPPGSPAWASGDESSSSAGSAAPLAEEHRLFLARFAAGPGLLPAVHPGEAVFCARPPPAPTLDARALRPQSALERLFLRAAPARQAALLRQGHLSLLYRCVPACPPPVLRWLFQMTAVPPEAAQAARALWDITVHRLSAAEQPWCPTVPEIGQAFCRLGANLGALHRLGLLPLELCPAAHRPPEWAPAASALVLATQLGDICKLVALCVAVQPGCYPDRARLALLTLLCFVALDRALRCQPLPDLQHLLLCLLEGIGDWQQQLPDLCLSLCQLSQHHHNLVAVVRLLPDVTERGRELRRRLGLCVMARLLGEPLGTVLPGRAHAELRALCRLLALVRPGALQRLVLAGCQREPRDADWEACYLSHSLLGLASAVVGAERLPEEQRGLLRHLCAQLDRQLGAGLREGAGLLFRTQLKGLAALTYVKWQELLAQGPAR